MLLGSHYNYRTCPICGNTLPLNRDYFKRMKLVGGKEAYHKVCKRCEKKQYLAREWRDGKLLCHECGQYLDVSCFSKNPDMKLRDCHSGICKDCQVKRQKRIEPNKPDALRLKQVLTQRYHGAKERAEKRGLEFNLTLDYLLSLWEEQKGICALSGLQMTYERYSGRIGTNVSIDKIDRNKGYIQGNVQLVCMACNQIKSDLSEETMYSFCKKIVEQYESKSKECTTAA